MKPERPWLSIITVCFNADRTIAKTIRSVLGQGDPGVEYIVVDGGSNDGTLKVLAEHRERIRIFSSKDLGISDAFNRGLALSSGEWIGTINADDWYEEGAFDRLKSMATRTDVLCGAMNYWRKDRLEATYAADPGLLRKEMTVNHQACFVRREVIRKAGGYRTDFRLAMDYEFFLRLQLGGFRMSPCPHVLANMSRDGVSDRRWVGSYQECLRAKRILGLSPTRAIARFLMQIFRQLFARVLLRVGLSAVVKWYRARYSVVRKVTE